MKSNPLLRQIFGVTLLTLLFTSFFFVGCGAFEEDNNQPSIETIDDKTLNAGDEAKVEVTITDTDVDDTHIISASSDDTTVATVSARDTTLTIVGMEAGTTTVMVSATDDSGQDNAAAVPLTFRVTVNEPLPPLLDTLVDKGTCIVGMTLQPGESCTYIANQKPVIFFVREDGGGCRSSQQTGYGEIFGLPVEIEPLDDDGYICVYDDIDKDMLYRTNFAADKNPDGTWTIDRASGNGSWPIDDVPSAPCQIPPLDENFRGIPALFVERDTCVLLSDGNFVSFACSKRGIPYFLVLGGTVQTPTEALVEFAGGDLLNKDGAKTPDGELTEFEVSDAIEGVIELKDNRSTVRTHVPKQDGVTIRGFHVLRGFQATGTDNVICRTDQDNAVIEELTRLAEDMLDIMRKNQ